MYSVEFRDVRKVALLKELHRIGMKHLAGNVSDLVVLNVILNGA